MSDLRDFFQGASNSIASNVSAPVDGIAWLLRKAGVPVPPNPMGGSDWMAEKGLTQQPQNRTAGLLGEFAGMTAPMVAAAKAPQIAKGLLSLDDKAMEMGRVAIENRMVNSGMIQPATVWHGSPHKFNKFDSSKIGTGEGAQAYGHGLYLAENPAVAKGYRDKLSGAGYFADDGKYFMKNDSKGTFHSFDPKTKADALINEAEFYKDAPASLYKVDLPDEHIAKMLDWDKPLSQQHPDVQTAFGGKLTPEGLKADPPGSALYNSLIGNWDKQSVASDQLFNAGIPGIRYLDGGSRGTGAGTSNYVVFPGNEDILKILERNGKGLLD